MTALAEVHALAPVELRALQRRAADAAGLAVHFRDPLKGGGQGPELTIIPPGRFRMGATEDERRFGDLPQQPVDLPEAYAIGRHAVTAEAFSAFADATGFAWEDHLLRTSGQEAVVNITCQDALAYLAWLSAESGQVYRLPSEAEWEYAARAGSLTAYCFGPTLGCGEANVGGLRLGAASGGWRRWLPFCVPLGRACEVASYPANVWGLYEVHGNVWEFTSDPWQGPLDAVNHSARNPAGNWLVTKGGSWFEGVEAARSAARKPRLLTELDTNLGLRVLRQIAAE